MFDFLERLSLEAHHFSLFNVFLFHSFFCGFLFTSCSERAVYAAIMTSLIIYALFSL
jgi:hypothetical protein